MNIHKDKQFDVLLTILAENLAYQKVLSGIVLTAVSAGNIETLETLTQQMNQKVSAGKADVLNNLLSDFGDIDDLINP